MKINHCIYSQSNYLILTAIAREQKQFIKIAFAVHLSAEITAEGYRSESEALKSAVLNFVFFIMLKNKIEQSAAQRCLRTFELRVLPFGKTSGIKVLSFMNAPLSEVFPLLEGSGKTMAFENRHVGCKEREKINRRRTLCTLRINFFEATPQTACIFSKEMTHTENHGDNDEKKEKRYYCHSDHLGSAQFVTDWRGKQYEHIEYTPYGKLWTYKSKTAKLFLTTYNNFLAKQPEGLIEETAPGIDSYRSGLRERSLMKRRGCTITAHATLTRSIVGGCQATLH
ncbi:hypothetical protein TPE_1574 [Treponema pedis str. T A4]|uniref:YD repeat-containing protein n=1 Tax=Treponema pedis str. T A4 TaxID=1291379 RepID=S6A8M1_9SPIR|nr:hypothetical protein [Treponema pedis]AGT44069.1 hypothetical protein TPE_1574 [Treponema pedis str. T A4]